MLNSGADTRSNVLLAQDLAVTGKITSSEDGSALPGVNVVVKGPLLVQFPIQMEIIPSPHLPIGTLVFTFIGLATQEVPINNRATVNLTMEQDIQQLSEVVVTALGIERNKNELGYAAQQVSGDQMPGKRC